MRSRAAVLLGVVAILTGGCAGAGSSASNPTLGAYDQSFVDSLVAKGWGEPESIMLAMAKVEVVSADDHSAHVVETFPTGETADVAISVTPGGSGDPGVLQVSRAATGKGSSITLAYHVSSLADITTRSVARAGPASFAALARYIVPLPVAPVAAEDGPGADVVVQAGFQKGAEAVFDAYVERMQAFLKAEGQVDPLVQSIKSIGSVFEALDLSKRYRKLMERIDAAEACAKNPTNPLTVKAYADDPGTRDRLVGQVDQARLDLKTNAAATYIGMLNEGLADLSKQAWLGIVVGAGDAWASKTLDALNERSVSDLEASITKCEKESPSPTSDESPTPPAETVPPLPSDSTEGSTPPTRVQGTINWNVSGPNDSSSGSITFIGKAFMDIGDYQVQPGSTYVYDYQASYCGGTHKSGVLEAWIVGGNGSQPKPGVGQVNLVGGAGSPIQLFLHLGGDSYTCTDGTPKAFFDAAPGCSRIVGTYSGGSSGVYEFSCELRSGNSGNIQGTLSAAP